MVIVPATAEGLHPEVIPAILRQEYSPEVIPCKFDGDYSVRLAVKWERRARLVVIEHDVVINRDVISELIACSHPWCCIPYDGGNAHTLGCTKFDTAHLGRFPVPTTSHWLRLAEDIYEALRSKGYRPHVHHDPKALQHHHNWRNNGWVSGKLVRS